MKKKHGNNLFRSFLLCLAAVLLIACGAVFEKAEAMKDSWNILDGNLVYIDGSGSIIRNGWHETNGLKYYLQEDGSRTYGKTEIGGTTYYFDQNGRLAEGWCIIDDKCMYVQNGKPLTGWQTIGNSTYYFDEDGSRHTGWLETKEGTYYLRKDGTPASGWITLDNRQYLLDANGKKQTKTFTEKGETVFLDPWLDYARFDPAVLSYQIASVKGNDLLTFGKLEADSEDLANIRKEIDAMTKDGDDLGFAVYVPDEGGIAYHIHDRLYSASTIKGIFAASLYDMDPDAYDEYTDLFEDTIYYSDNYSYEVLYETYGDDVMSNAAKHVMVDPSIFSSDFVYYAEYSPAELAQLWLYAYEVINSGSFPEDLKECYEETEVSAIRDALGSVNVQSKAGWLDTEDDQVMADAGVVFAQKGPYIIAVMSEEHNDPAQLEKLIRLLDTAVNNARK